MSKTCYIASGWFNEDQARDLENIKRICTTLNIKFFSPKDECVVKPNANAEERKKTFDDNLNAIKNADYVIVNTRDKDMGTIFEAGYAHAINKPIIYFCDGLKGKFNLMLAQSGSAVATSCDDLVFFLINIGRDINYKHNYEDEIE